MNCTKDYIADILKYISTVVFLYVAIMAVIYVKKEICDVPTAIIFVISAIITLIGVLGSVLLSDKKKSIWNKKIKNVDKRENLYLLIATLFLFSFQILIVWNVVFRTSWDPGAVWYGAHYVSLGDNEIPDHMPANEEFDPSKLNDCDGFKPSPYGLYETAATMNNSWGYCAWDQNWKDAKKVLEIKQKLNSMGINYLLNVGPDHLGRIPGPSQKILREVAKYL